MFRLSKTTHLGLAGALALGLIACGSGSSTGTGNDAGGGNDAQTATCGNGVVEGNELCDGVDLGGNACTDLGFDGGSLLCNSTCDGFNTDNCTGTGCGNDTIEGTEVCDGADLAGEDCVTQGFDSGTLGCSAFCDAYDTSSCVSVMCGNDIIEGTEVCDGLDLAGEDCVSLGWLSGTLACFPDCQGFDDSNCSGTPTCGDNVIEGSEVCDGLDLGGEDCTTIPGTFTGGTLGCNAACDDYDTSGCTGGGQTCGNNIQEGNEICDGTDLTGLDCTDLGFTGGTLACENDCLGHDVTGCTNPIPPTVFRITDLDLRDPHAFVDAPFIGCSDATDPPGLFGTSLNGELENLIIMDNDTPTDGTLDLSILFLFRPLDQAATGGGFDLVLADCTAPMAGTSCTPTTPPPPEVTTHTNQTVGVCVSPFAGTVSTAGYTPGITEPTDDCYFSGRVNLTLDLLGTPLSLSDVQIGAVYVGNPATDQVDGLMAGFISETDADNTIIDIPVIGLTPLSSLLPGGTGGGPPNPANCAPHDDRDVGLDGVTSGWWFYFNFTATVVSCPTC